MEAWHYDPAEDLDQSMVDRLRRFPRKPDMLVYGLRWFAAALLRGWLRLYHRLAIVGRENLPAEGSFVLIANHASHLDTLCLLSALPLAKLHRAFPAAAKDYFFVSAPRVFLSAVVVNALPFERKHGPRQSLSLCTRVLDNPGNILILFPEGTRSTTGAVDEFRPGIGLLLAGRDVPVVPCYLDGAFAAWPKGAVLPWPWSVRLTIGKPRSYAQHKPDKEAAVQICNELREAVLALAPVRAGATAFRTTVPGQGEISHDDPPCSDDRRSADERGERTHPIPP
jgi:1-acyl-sn-glycerol-3-phosphate acyltransferase